MSRLTSGEIDLPAFTIANDVTQERYAQAEPVQYPEEWWSDRLPYVLGG